MQRRPMKPGHGPVAMPSVRYVERVIAVPQPMGPPDKTAPSPYPTQDNSAHWGQRRIVGPNQDGPWLEGQRKPLLRLDKILNNRIPSVQNIVLAANPVNWTSSTSLLRWELSIGVGGGNTTLVLDAGGMQQLSVSAEQMTLSIFASDMGQFFSSPFVAPAYDVDCSVFFADGATNTDAPTFSEFFELTTFGGAQDTILLPIPNGANGFRVLGSNATNGPLTADRSYTLLDTSAFAGEFYLGDYIEGIRVVPIPVNSQMRLLQIQNTSAVTPVTRGIIEWHFDL